MDWIWRAARGRAISAKRGAFSRAKSGIGAGADNNHLNRVEALLLGSVGLLRGPFGTIGPWRRCLRAGGAGGPGG